MGKKEPHREKVGEPHREKQESHTGKSRRGAQEKQKVTREWRAVCLI